MDTQLDANKTVPWYRKMADRRKLPKTFNIYKEHLDILNSPRYKENSSALVRLLMDKYFSGKLPEVEKEFDDLTRIKS